MRIFVLAMLVVLAAFFPVWAEPVPCTNVFAYFIDDDPADVRAGPSIEARRIAVIPNKHEDGTSITITGSEGEWVRTTRADTVEEVTFEGLGWVHNSRLGTWFQHSRPETIPLYDGPNTKAPVVRWFRYPESMEKYRPVFLTCRGGWVRVRINGSRGWLAPRNQCGLAWATCP